MAELVTIPRDELEHLQERAKKLAEDKSYLQLAIHLMNRISAAPGLENTIETMLKSVLDVIGATNIILYYQIDNSLFYTDVYGKRMLVDRINDALVQQVFDTRQSVEDEHAFADTQMLTPEFTNAYTWVFPLLVGTDLIGILKMENLHFGIRGLYQQLPVFFHYTALVLKNEILGHTRLQHAYEQVSKANAELTKEVGQRRRAEEEIRQLNAELEQRVIQRTAELLNANERLVVELGERKRAEEALQRSEQRYRQIVETAEEGIWLVDREWKTTFVNARMEHMLGWQAGEMLGRHLAEFMDEEGRRHTLELMGRRELGVRETQNFRFIRRDGKKLWALLSANVVADESGEFVGFLAMVTDITERKRAEDRLRESEERFRDLYEDAPNAYFIGVDGLIRRCNRRAGKLLGYSVEELTGRPAIELYADTAHGKETATQVLQRFRAGETVRDQELEMQKADGSPVWISLTVDAVRDVQGRVLESRSMVVDIAERKRAENIMNARLRLLQFAAVHSLDELLQATLDELETLTGSRIGFCHFFEADQRTLSLQAWSTRTLRELCTVEGKGLHYNVSEADVWVECIRERRPVIHNDYASLPHRKWMPPGHAPVVRELVVPVFRGGQIVAILGVGNKPKDYDEGDVEIVSSLADLAWDIAERKQAEERLRESEGKLRAIFDHTFQFIGLMTPDGTVIEANRGALELAGVSKPDMLGKPFWETSWWKDSVEMQEKLRAAVQTASGGQFVRFEATHPTHDGKLVYVDFSFTPVRDERGHVVLLIPEGRDITERKLAERERLAHLRFFESMDQVNRAVQGTNDVEQMMSGVLDAVLTIFDCDRAWLFYPCDPDAPSFRVPMEITRPEYPGAGILNADVPMPPDMVQNLREVLESTAPVTYIAGTERPINKASAEQFGVKSQMMVALCPRSGKPWVFGLHQCSYPRVWTSEEKRLFQEIGWRLADGLTSLLMLRNLRESEGRLAEAQRIAHVGHWDHDLDGDRITASEETLRIFGQPSQERTVGFERFQELIHPEDRQQVLRTVEAALRGDPSHDVEYRVLRPTGEVRFVHGQWNVTREEGARPGHLFGTLQDITERKRAEEEIRRLNRELEQRVADRTAQLEAANKELEAFAYSVSHDLRAPLRHIDGFVDLLEKRTATALDQESRHYMATISESAKRMGTLIDDLLAFSRMGRQEILTIPLDLGVLVKEAVRELEPEARGREIHWYIADLPVIAGDPAMLRQVLVNLLSNALKYTRPRQQTEITIGCLSGKEDEAVVFVRDNGVGFDADYADKLFGVFQRLHGADEFEGTGIGLANVRRIVGRHGGRTWAEGAVDHGATFYFSLPQTLRGG